jgi:hypothetical protein
MLIYNGTRRARPPAPEQEDGLTEQVNAQLGGREYAAERGDEEEQVRHGGVIGARKKEWVEARAELRERDEVSELWRGGLLHGPWHGGKEHGAILVEPSQVQGTARRTPFPLAQAGGGDLVCLGH